MPASRDDFQALRRQLGRGLLRLQTQRDGDREHLDNLIPLAQAVLDRGPAAVRDAVGQADFDLLVRRLADATVTYGTLEQVRHLTGQIDAEVAALNK